MKKIIIAAAVVFTTGILSSCNRQHNIKISSSSIMSSFMCEKKNLASGD